MPFFINLLGGEHPAQVPPGGCEVEWLSVECPGAETFQTFCSAIEINVIVLKGELKLSAQLHAPVGAVVLV